MKNIIFILIAIVVIFFISQRWGLLNNDVASPIGGEFSLINQHGDVITNDNLKGKYLLVYFGYTSCPDICPAALSQISNLINNIKNDVIIPVFITIDPAHDNLEIMQDYSLHFNKKFQMLTGDEDEIKKVIKSYKIYVAFHKPDEYGNYSIDHSGFIYFMDKNGKYLHHFAPDTTAKDMLKIVKKYLR